MRSTAVLAAAVRDLLSEFVPDELVNAVETLLLFAEPHGDGGGADVSGIPLPADMPLRRQRQLVAAATTVIDSAIAAQPPQSKHDIH